MFNNFIKFVALVFLSITFSFAISDRDNPRKAGKENFSRSYSKKNVNKLNQVNIQKEIKSVNDFIDNDQFRPQVETNPYIDPRDAEFEALDNPEIAAPVRSADHISTVDKLKNGTISIENLFSDLVPNSRTTPDFPEYTVCSEGCDYNDLATAIDSVPNQSTIFITEPGEYLVVGSEIIDRSIWIKGLSPEETIITGALDLEDIPEGLIYFEKENYADWSLEENQDRIKSDIWITRGDNRPIFNAAVETHDDADNNNDMVPTNTLWAQGRTADVDSSDYEPFRPMTSSNPPSIVGIPLSMQTISSTYETPDSVVYFEKENYADWSLEENQDRIKSDIWITRGDDRPIFNAAVETHDDADNNNDMVPTNTLWAQGRTADVDSSDYQPFRPMTSSNPPSIVGLPLSMQTTSSTYEAPDSVVYFKKENYADPSLEENQDRIADSVWITRGDSKPIFNAAREDWEYVDDGYGGNTPSWTRWALGRTDSVESEDYKTFRSATAPLSENYETYPNDIWGGSKHIVGNVLSMKVLDYTLYNKPDSVVFHNQPADADLNDSTNLDMIADSVWIGRYENDVENQLPYGGLRWAIGRTADVDFADYVSDFSELKRDWDDTSSFGVIILPNLQGKVLSLEVTNVMVDDSVTYYDVVITDWLHGGLGGFSYYRGAPGSYLPTDDIVVSEYFDVEFTYWTSGGNGGGFAYYRGAPGAYLPSDAPREINYFDVEFTKWTQDGNGGGFAYYRGAPGAYLPSDAPREIDFFDVVFTKWTQDGDGGGFAYYRGAPGADLPSQGTMFTIVADNDPLYVRFSDLTIANGTGVETAGAIQVNSPDTSETTTIELDNIVAYNNVNMQESGGFINNNEIVTPGLLFFNVNNSVFRNNISADDDGGVFALSNVHATITNSLFEDNHADDNGGVFYGRSSSSSQFSLVIYGSEFRNNFADSYGGVIHLEYTENDTSASGLSGLYVANSTFSGNRTNYSGGAISTDGYNGDMVVYETDFNNNTADSYGGVLYVRYNTDAYFNNVSFDNNMSEYGSGGVIYLYNNTTGNNLDFHHCSFTNNSSNGSGGVIHSTNRDGDTDLNIYSSDFINNTSGGDGGVLFLSEGTTYIESSTFAGNTNTDHGASVMFLYQYNQTTNIVNSTFVNNEVSANADNLDYGYAFWVYGPYGNQLDLNNCTVAFNSGNGAINAWDSNIYLSSTIVAGNTGKDIHRAGNGNVTSHGNNIIGNLDSTGIFTIDHDNGMDWVGGYDDSTGGIISGDTNFVNTYSDAIDPLLVLVEDGETTPHAMPYPGSIAVDNGTSTYTLATDPSTVFELDYDVRGMPRTWIVETDIGSIERQASDPFGEQIPPAMINDLSAEPSLDGGLVLNWTAVGEDGINGTADSYMVYYGTAPFGSELDPDVSSIVLPIEPAYSGNSESFYLSELDYGTEYYLAVVAVDVVGQSSPLGDPVSMATMQPPVAEINVNELSITLPAESEGSRYGTITNTGVANLNFSTTFSEDEAQTRNANDKVLFVTGAAYPSESNFYWLDVATGVIEELGQLYDSDGVPIGGSATDNGGITAIAQNPVDNLWYGVETEGRLFSFTPGDPNATIIGEHTATGHIPDMDFGPDGTLYGWSEGCDCLTKINLETAEVDEFGTQEFSTWGTGLAIDPNGEYAYMKAEYEFYTLDLATGAQIGDYIELDAPDYLVNMLDIGSNGDIYSGLRTDYSDGEFVFCTIDTSSGAVTQFYTYDIEYVSAIAVGASGWLITDPNKGMLSSGESVQVAMNYFSNGLVDSTYTGQLLFETNDPSAENTVFNITLIVSGDSLPPVLLTEALPNAIEDEAYSFQLEGSDSNGDVITYSLTSGPEWLGISETGELDGTPANEHVGDSLMITVSLSDGMSAAESVFYISVENTNDAPASAEALADVEVDEDAEPLTIDLSQAFSDEDAGDLLEYSVQGYLTFRKVSNADWTMEENQDRVADNVWLTRQSSQSIFNIALEDAYSADNQSPLGTEWAYGHADHAEGLTFQHFKATVNNAPPSSIGKPLVLHTLDEDAYYDMMVHQWTGGGPGGGFAWTRSSDGSPVMTPEINGSNLVFHFHPDASGETEIVIVATDQSGATALDTVNISVNSVNDSPGDFTLLVPENNSVVVDLTPTLTWEAPTDPDNSEPMGEGGMRGARAKAPTVAQNQNMTRSIESYNVYIGSGPGFTSYDVVATVNTSYYTPEYELEEDGVYYWMIEAVDNGGSVTVSETWSFTVNAENSVPDSLVLLTPIEGEETGLMPTFSWTTSADMDANDTVSYTLNYGSDPSNFTSVSTGNNLTYTPDADLMDNTGYAWQVVATDQMGATFTTGFQSFYVNSANDNPNMFGLISPDSGSTVSNLRALLVWSPTADLDGDNVMFDVHLNGITIGTTNHNYFYADSLVEDMTYTWSVSATDNNGGSTESGTWSFTVNTQNAPPSSFALISPDSGIVLNTQVVNFEWEASSDMDPMDEVHYSIDIHSDTTHMNFETDLLSLLSENLMDNSVYHWGVRAFDMNGGMTENIGGPEMFVINVANDAPTAASLVAPLDGSIQTHLAPSFFWTRSSDPDPMDHVGYSMNWWVVGGTESQSVNTDSNGVTLEVDLMDNSGYGWAVNSMDMNGAEGHSDTAHFYTDAFPEPPLNFATIAPENNADGIATEVEFIWNRTNDPDPLDEIHYQLVYATDWEDSSSYVFSEVVQDTSLIISMEDNALYYWGVIAMDNDGFMVGSNDNTPNTLVIGTLGIDDQIIPDAFALHQNYPNPFNPTTIIHYDVPEPAQVKIMVFDVLGRKISTLFNEHQNPGFKSILWNGVDEFGSPVSAGMYFYHIQAGSFNQTRKMILLK